MATREIPRSEWRTFFDRFSRLHEGWLTTLEIVGADIGDQLEGSEMPLQGISADLKGSDPDAVLVSLGTEPSDQLTHMVEHATRVAYEQTEDGAQESMEIQSADGMRAILRFRSLDGARMIGDTIDERARKAGS